MGKLVVLLQLKEGVDPDEFWKSWPEGQHSRRHLDEPGLIKYVISRVKQRRTGEIPDKIWGMAELWHESRETHDVALDAYHSALRRDPELQHREAATFPNQLAWNWVVWVEEKVIREDAGFDQAYRDGKIMLKLVDLIQLPEGTDHDEFWKYWVEEYAPRQLERFGPRHLSPGVLKYAVNRVTEVQGGMATDSKMWGMGELWYESKEAWDALKASRSADITVEQKRDGDDFQSRLAWRSVLIMEEKVIVNR